MHNAGLATSEDTAVPHSPRLQPARMDARWGSSCSQPDAEVSLAGLPEDPPSSSRSRNEGSGTLQPVCTSFSRKGTSKSASSRHEPFKHQTDGRSSSPCPSGTGPDVLESSFHFRPPSQPSSPAAADDGSSSPKHSPFPHQSPQHNSSRGSPSRRSPTRRSPSSPPDNSRQRRSPAAEPAQPAGQQELEPVDGSAASPHLHGLTRRQHGNPLDSRPTPAYWEHDSVQSRPGSSCSSRGEQETDGPMRSQPSSRRPGHDSAEGSGGRSDAGSADSEDQDCQQQQQQQQQGSPQQADEADEACSHPSGSPQGLAQLPGRAWAGRKRRRIRVHRTPVHRPPRRRAAQGESMHAGAMHEGGQASDLLMPQPLLSSAAHRTRPPPARQRQRHMGRTLHFARGSLH